MTNDNDKKTTATTLVHPKISLTHCTCCTAGAKQERNSSPHQKATVSYNTQPFHTHVLITVTVKGGGAQAKKSKDNMSRFKKRQLWMEEEEEEDFSIDLVSVAATVVREEDRVNAPARGSTT